MNWYIVSFGIMACLCVIFRKQLSQAWDWIAKQNTFSKMVDEGKLK